MESGKRVIQNKVALKCLKRVIELEKLYILICLRKNRSLTDLKSTGWMIKYHDLYKVGGRRAWYN